MTKNNYYEDIKQVKEYLEALSQLSGNMAQAVFIPNKLTKKSEEQLGLITAQAVLIAEHFSILEGLLKETKLIKNTMGEEV